MTDPAPSRASPSSIAPATLAVAGSPTLQQAQLAQRALQDRFTSVPWGASFLIGLVVVCLLGVLAMERFEDFRQLCTVLGF
jgi:hypothetical protein